MAAAAGDVGSNPTPGGTTPPVSGVAEAATAAAEATGWPHSGIRRFQFRRRRYVIGFRGAAVDGGVPGCVRSADAGMARRRSPTTNGAMSGLRRLMGTGGPPREFDDPAPAEPVDPPEGSADAGGVAAIAALTPRAMASAPTRPT